MPSFTHNNHNIHRADLQRMVQNYSNTFSRSDTPNDDTVMEGHFDYRYHYGGLSVHSSRATETQNISNLVELPPCLSINILFEGKIDFSLGTENYQLGITPQQVECSAIVLKQPEILTRHLKKGMRVTKLNLFAERSWLEARSQNQKDLQQLNSLFQHSEKFSHWQPTDEIIALAETLIEYKASSDYKGSLEYEYLAIQLLSCCIEQISLLIKQQPIESTIAKTAKKNLLLKQRIDEQLLANLSLNDIAQSLGISISTLQRKFKAAYGITVNNYCRQRRLEMARSALMVDGLSIGEAAYLAGYNHSSNFISAFKKQFSVTPTALVKTHQLQINH